jgi:hypothetical protein
MSLLGKILALLNILAAAGFGYLAVLNYTTRQKWTRPVYQRELTAEGLPIQEQYNDPTLPRNLYQRDEPPDANAEWFKRAFPGQSVSVQNKLLVQLKQRSTPGSFFAAVNEAAKKIVTDSKGKVEVLESVLLPLAANGIQYGQYKKTIDDAKKSGKIDVMLEQAARRRMLAQALLPLEEIRPGGNREALAVTLGDLSQPYEKLEQLLEERFDTVLRPQIPSPDLKPDRIFGLAAGTVTQFKIQYKRSAKDEKVHIGILDAASGKQSSASPAPVSLTLANVTGQPRIELSKEGSAFTAKDKAFGTDQVLACNVTITVNNKPVHFWFIEREPLEQRQAIAYLLFTLSQVAQPTAKGELLNMPSADLVEGVVGRIRFNHAAEMQMVALRQAAERRRGQIKADLYTFAEQYRVLTKERLPYLKLAVEHYQSLLADWKKQLTNRTEHYNARKVYYEGVVKQLKDERSKATLALEELKLWQQRLFQAQKAGSGLIQGNLELERKIRNLEQGPLTETGKR